MLPTFALYSRSQIYDSEWTLETDDTGDPIVVTGEIDPSTGSFTFSVEASGHMRLHDEFEYQWRPVATTSA